MNVFSLSTLIDDILLMIRNNNISESEDFSRQQIASWIISYEAMLAKKQKDSEDRESGEDDPDDSLTQTMGPVELIDMPHNGTSPIHTRRTKDEIPELLGDSDANIISVCDESGCTIQRMSKQRRHYHYFRHYTFGELTYFYQDGYIYIQGTEDMNKLKYIYYTAIFTNGDDNSDADDIIIPGWMIPQIKQLIFDNELKMMLRLPSDDSDNATVANVKPHGPQDQEE